MTASKTFHYITGDAASLALATKIAKALDVLKHADADKLVIFSDTSTYEMILDAATMLPAAVEVL